MRAAGDAGIECPRPVNWPARVGVVEVPAGRTGRTGRGGFRRIRQHTQQRKVCKQRRAALLAFLAMSVFAAIDVN